MRPNPLKAEIVTHTGSRIAKITLFGAIGSGQGFHARNFRDALRRLRGYDALIVHLDSPGGSLLDAWIMYDYLKIGPAYRHPSRVLITGECSGAAILIAMGFKQIYMRSRAYMRFEPVELRDAAARRRATNTMARVIAKRTQSDPKEILQWMTERRRFLSQECLQHRLCDAVMEQ